MPTYPELKSPPELEAEVLRFWKDQDIFRRSLAQGEGKPTFVFYEGPPTANGMPHNGHVLTRVIKDLFPRYRTMRGYHVPRKAGWDTHGLPVEVEVEKELGIHGKAAIEAYGLEPFARACIGSVFRYTKEWEELTERVGFWADLDDAYVTYHRSYVESVWWALSELFRKGLLYQDYKVVWWWPQGGTALSSGEVGEGYRTTDDPSVTVRFKVVGEANTSFLAWTTTPWTLSSNVALAVNPELDYAYVEREGEVFILAEGLKDQVEGGTVLKVVKGADLVGMRYAPVFDWISGETGEGAAEAARQRAQLESGDRFVVVPGAHVTLGAGTGIVHTAPAFGEDDFVVRKTHGLGFLQLVGSDGAFAVGPFRGRFCKEADKDIVRLLKESGALFKADTVRHEYPFCPRADADPLIQYARPAWFIRTTALKDAALANNAAVRWLPETIQNGRFGDFLRNNVDWALSRERFWGTPLNIWQCETCGHRVAPASTAEIARRNPDAFDPSVDRDLQVHKPWVDRITFPCDACGKAQMQRVPEVIDCWFDSGCMPFAQHGWPHQNHETFASSFPADFISEAVDQTRGWFYSLLMISTLLFDDETCARFGLDALGYPRPYKNVIVLGHVCDSEGKKESKSKGNYTSPDLVLKGWMKVRALPDASLKPGQVAFKPAQVRSLGLDPNERLTAQDGTLLEVVGRPVKGKDSVHLHPDDLARLGQDLVLKPPFPPPGADAFRWLFYASNPPWNNTRISLKAILEGQREFLFRLKNVHQFFVLNAGDGYVPAAPSTSNLLDGWILHELDVLVEKVTGWLDSYLLFEPARAIQDFVDGLSNWWLRRSRDRFDDSGADGKAARDTLYHVLVTLSRLTAPFVPFMAEAMHRSLAPAGAPESVHLWTWPETNAAFRAPELARDMSLVRELASLGLSARANVGVRVRQPLAAAEVVLADDSRAASLGALVELLRDELNVREVRFSTDAGRFVNFRVKADFKSLGARLGKDMKAVAAGIAALDGATVRAQLASGTLVVAGHALGPTDVLTEVSPREGFQASGSAAAVVALHAELTEDLLEEGLAREVASRLQGLRKAAGLAYGEQARAWVLGEGRAAAALARHGAEVSAHASVVLVAGDAPTDAERVAFELDGVAVTVALAR